MKIKSMFACLCKFGSPKKPQVKEEEDATAYYLTFGDILNAVNFNIGVGDKPESSNIEEVFKMEYVYTDKLTLIICVTDRCNSLLEYDVYLKNTTNNSNNEKLLMFYSGYTQKLYCPKDNPLVIYLTNTIAKIKQQIKINKKLEMDKQQIKQQELIKDLESQL